jgi:hypothetical protein
MSGHTPETRCTNCGAVAEVKPFGRDGLLICYDCWMADDSPTYSFAVDDDGSFRRLPDRAKAEGR